MNSWRCHKTVKPGVNLWSCALIHNHPTRDGKKPDTDQLVHASYLGGEKNATNVDVCLCVVVEGEPDSPTSSRV